MAGKKGMEQDPHVRGVMALQFLKERVMQGKTNKQIAEERGINPKTVARTLTWAEKAGIFVELEDALIRDIAPIAVNAIRSALLAGEDVPRGAIEILQGLHNVKKNHPTTVKDAKDADDLVSYITKIREKAQLDADTTDGQLLPAPIPLQLGPAIGYDPETIVGVGTSLSPDPPRDDSSDPERVPDGNGAPNTGPAPR
jgi:hypothetical protein